MPPMNPAATASMRVDRLVVILIIAPCCRVKDRPVDCVSHPQRILCNAPRIAVFALRRAGIVKPNWPSHVCTKVLAVRRKNDPT
jgi:hypothetical protein